MNRLRSGLIWACCACLAAAALIFVARSGSPLPYYDEWHNVRQLLGREPVTLAWLWQQNREHRLPIPKLVLTGLARLTGMDARAGMILSAALLVCLAARMLLVARRLRGMSSLADVFLPLVLLHWGHYENLLWQWTLAFSLSVTLFGIALSSLAQVRERASPTSTVAVGLCLAALPLCSGAGPPLVPPLALWLCLTGLHRWRSQDHVERRAARVIVVLAALAVAACGLYFVGLQPFEYSTPKATWLARIASTVKILSMGLGPAARTYWPYSGAFAIAVLVMSLGLLATTWIEWRERRLAVGALFAALASSLTLAAAIGYGRTIWGPEAAFLPRYALLAVPFWCVAYFIPLVCEKRVVGPILQAALALVLIGFSVENTGHGMRFGELRRAELQRFLRDVQLGLEPSILAKRNSDLLGPNWPRVAPGLDLLRERRLGPFGSPPSDPTELPAPVRREIEGSRSDADDIIAFHSSRQTILLLDHEHGFSGLEPLHQVALGKAPGSLRITSSGSDPYLLLPPVACPQGSDVIIRLSLVSPATTAADVYFETASVPGFAEGRKVTEKVARGPNTLYLRIPGADLGTRLRLDPMGCPGTLALASLEGRAVPSCIGRRSRAGCSQVRQH